MSNAMRAPFLMVATLLIVAFAGCADQGGPAVAQEAQSTKEVEVTSTTGGIRGVVVDSSIVPLAGITIKLLNQDKQAITDEGGEFVFSLLEPGVYFLATEHPLYSDVQQTANVEAGVESPKPIRILLERNEIAEPTLVTLAFKGHIKCSTNISGVGYSEECGEGMGYPCQLPDTVYECGERIGKQAGSSPQIWFTIDEPQLATLLVEQVWEPSLSLATGNTAAFRTHVAIDWICDPFCGGDQIAAVNMESPLYLRAEQEALDSREFTPDTDLSTFVYSGSSNGAIIEQGYEQYVTLTWGLPAPEAWSFVLGDEYPF
jgi:hypothetical protein